MWIFSPDKNIQLLHYYHLNNKIILPLGMASLITYNLNDFKKINYFINNLGVLNLSYHSYFSTSTVITDYIKPKFLQNTSKVLNFKLHILASLGYFYYFNKFEKDLNNIS